ncbi:ribonuclease E [Agaricicola taiwanensis]|uniref:Ribonuclease E n=1 Tax=Agaricicola taiwanensis TaxID=591372 RepID=A0A8J2YI79_9RHOB|nr:Rne/Rng family ribonuclease [Agaricicola taiwanensis]GGE43798.1 ribonuclease E [Agaricicola taiwanensis]
MANKMLIDATHPEETRVTVVRGNRIEEFDFESASRRQLRGNIYLAKVTRVEPSLQAAFVEYGGNRHGFLAFSEIHPDYYQIPVADRQALLEEDERAEQRDEEEQNAGNSGRRRRGRGKERNAAKDMPSDETLTEEAPVGGEDQASGVEPAEQVDASPVAEEAADDAAPEDNADGDDDSDQVDSVGSDDALEELPSRRERRSRVYKIQEVIKRRQVLLIQVVKEERGNKGAALTTYLSLAGRYCVLMPNTARGGGISRKITSAQDRKRLKEIVTDLEVPEGMGVILRTAGANRTKTEVKRDFEYLLRMWETVREMTLSSVAPKLVYEEGSLVKRAIRDLYNKDIDEVLVAGDSSYKDAKDFMRMLMPSHAKNVKPYREATPIFTKYGVESQLDAMFSPQVTLKSGGYIVINQTEALVAIDVNSGRSTREHNIEDTALKTNLEAAEEVARQLRLRDLAGLIVVDFIDMEETRNNRAVEKKLKECLEHDRARLQVGRISHFGLLEMSRQRIRTGVLESSSEICPHCAGAGIVRAVPSVALHVLRMVEEFLLRNPGHNLNVRTRGAVALYVLNQKRAHLHELEDRFGVTILFSADEALAVNTHLVIEKGEASNRPAGRVTAVQIETIEPEIDDAEPNAAEAAEGESEDTASGETEPYGGEDTGGRRRRRRRRRRGGNGGQQADAVPREQHDAIVSDDRDDLGEDEATEAEAGHPEEGETSEGRKRRRRGRRGGRRNRREEDATTEAGAESPTGETGLAEQGGEEPITEAVAMGTAPVTVTEQPVQPETVPEAPAAEIVEEEPVPAAKPARKRAPRRKKTDAEAPTETSVETVEAPAPDAESATAQTAPSSPAPSAESPQDNDPEKPAAPARGGWWQRRIFGKS